MQARDEEWTASDRDWHVWGLRTRGHAVRSLLSIPPRFLIKCNVLDTRQFWGAIVRRVHIVCNASYGHADLQLPIRFRHCPHFHVAYFHSLYCHGCVVISPIP